MSEERAPVDGGSDGAGGPSPAPGGPGGGAPAGEPLPNLAVRAGQVFYAPGALFDRLRARPAWVGAVGLLVGLSLAATVLLPTELLVEAMQAGVPPDADPEAARSVEDFAESTLFQVFRFGGAVVFPLLQALVLAGLVMFIFNLVLGGSASFEQALSASAHALIIYAVGSLLVVPLILQTGDPETLLALDLLVPGLDPEAFLGRFLGGLNVFALWSAAVLGVGVGQLYPARSAGSSAALLVGLYAAAKLLTALLGF